MNNRRQVQIVKGLFFIGFLSINLITDVFNFTPGIILQHLALQSGIKINLTEAIKLPSVTDIETAPVLAISLLAQAHVYKKMKVVDVVSVSKLLTTFEEIQQLWMVEMNQGIQQKAPYLTRKYLVELQSSLHDVLLPLQSILVGCLKDTHLGEEDVLSCLEETELLSRLFKNDFLLYYEKVVEKGEQLSTEKIFQVWANFLMFRSYAVFRAKLLLILLNTYQKVGDQPSRLRLGFFSDKMVSELGVHLKYMKAIEHIFMKTDHKHDAASTEHFDSETGCKKYPALSGIGRGVSCKFKMCKLSSEKCHIKVAVFHKIDVQGAVDFEAETNEPFQAGVVFASQEARTLFEQYHLDMDEILSKSWAAKIGILYDIFGALKEATLVQNRRFINDSLEKRFSFKTKSKQTKNVNALKSQIEALKMKRAQDQKKSSFVRASTFRDEL